MQAGKVDLQLRRKLGPGQSAPLTRLDDPARHLLGPTTAATTTPSRLSASLTSSALSVPELGVSGKVRSAGRLYTSVGQ